MARWNERRGLRRDPRKQCINCGEKWAAPDNHHGYYCPDCLEYWNEHGIHRES